MFDIVKYLDGVERESSITDGEVRWLYKLCLHHVPGGGLFLELGLLHGRSACMFAYLAATKKGSYIGVDNFRCGRNSLREVVGYLDERGLLSWATIIESDTQSLTFEREVDFLHIDADHSSPGIDADVNKYVPLVKPGGIVAFDDYTQYDGEPSYPDIARAANAVCANSNWMDLGTVDGMKCFRRV
jgi:predicted O-methyltransferase YrrM